MEERSIYISSVDREKIGRSVTHDFKIKLQTTLKLDRNMKHEIALDSLLMTYSWHNINESYNNNKVKYSHDGGNTWETITFLMVLIVMKILIITLINIWFKKDMLMMMKIKKKSN